MSYPTPFSKYLRESPVLLSAHIKNISVSCQDGWKNTRSIFECMGILKSRGQGPKKMENYWTNLSRTFKKNVDLVPLIGE